MESARIRWRTALFEVIGLLLWFLVFTRLHGAVGKDAASATANAAALQSLERTLHLDIELWANRWLIGHPVLIMPAVYWYRLYYAVVVAVLAWLFLRHAAVYLKARRTLVAMTALALPVFWLLPMSPPRFARPGIVDVIFEHDIVGRGSRDVGGGQNLFSAMPSLHVGFSLWISYAVWSALRHSHPRWAWLSWLYPLGMAAVVLGTGNHYVLDIAGSVVLLGLSIAVAAGWARLAERAHLPRVSSSP
jgi:PAP2 superfamily protein